MNADGRRWGGGGFICAYLRHLRIITLVFLCVLCVFVVHLLFVPPATTAPSEREGERLLVLKEMPPASASTPWFVDYMRVLERFPRYAERGWHECDGAPPAGLGEEKLGYFGGTDHEEVAMRPMAHYLLTMALLGTDASYDSRPSGVSAEVVREHALSCFRYLLRTHVTGDLKRPTGKPWGDQPHSAWWTGKIATAGRLLDRSLTDADREALQRVVTHEAERLLERAPADAAAGESGAGDNAWSAELLAWAASLYPTHSQATRWEEKARLFLMNAFSVPQDRRDDTLVDGRAVREWVATSNLLPSFLAEGHGAVHFCYAALPLQSFASAYYAYAGARRLVPRSLFYHLDDVWRAAQGLYLFDGRFAYPAGQDWPRYTYGAYWMLPALVLLQSSGGEPSVARLIERALFRRFEQEQYANADGTFYGSRFSGGATTGRQAMFETDTYAMLATAYLLHRLQPKIWPPAREAALQESLAGEWAEPIAGVAGARAPAAFASFAWQGLRSEGGAPRGLFVPAGGDDMAEWGPDQLVGSFDLEGFRHARRITHHERAVSGGIAATGRIDEGLKEDRPGVLHHIAFAALPAERVAALFDLSLAAQAIRVNRSEGLQIYLPNDLFNGNRRALTSELGQTAVAGLEPADPAKPATARVANGWLPGRPTPAPEPRAVGSNWLNVDGKLGLVLAYGQEPFTLRQFTARDQHPTDPFRSLLVDLIDTPYLTDPTEYKSRQVVRDTIVLLIAGDVAATRAAFERAAVASTGQELARAVWITGATGRSYLVAANFADREQTLSLKPPRGGPALDVRLPPLDTLVVPAR